MFYAETLINLHHSCHLLPFEGESKPTAIAKQLGFPKRLSFQLLCFQSQVSFLTNTIPALKGTGLHQGHHN